MQACKDDVPGGYLWPSETLPGSVLVLKQAWRDEFLDGLDRESVIGLRLATSAGWPEAQGLEFVRNLPSLRRIDIYAHDIRDLSPLYDHPGLESINLDCPYRKFDFSFFDHLRDCSLNWRRGADSVLDCENLEYLTLAGFPYEDFQSINRLRRLRFLHVESRILERLTGLDCCRGLREIQAAYCPGLWDITALGSIKELESVWITSCKKVSDISPFTGHPSLRRLRIESCGEVESLRPLIQCLALESAMFIATAVSDGDLTPLLEISSLRKVAVANKRHHSHKWEELQRIIDEL